MPIYPRRFFEDAPDWVEFIATDSDGEVWGYNKKPIADVNLLHWISAEAGDPLFVAELIAHIDVQTIFWSDSLEEV